MFVWDETKRQKVIAKHSIDFALILDVFQDPFPVDFEDQEHSDDTERRYGIIGMSANYGLILLIYTMAENGNIRFITARKAEKWLVKIYEENRKRLR